MSEKSKKWKVLLKKIDNPKKTKTITAEYQTREEAIAMSGDDHWVAISASEIKSLLGGLSVGSKTAFKVKDTIRFCKGMGTMIKAGISTVDALSFYAANLPSKAQQDVINKIIKKLQEGASPHEAFQRSGAFSSMFIGIIKAGYTAGNLELAMLNYARLQEVQNNFTSRMKRLLATPVIVFSILIALFIASQVIIVPKIEQMLSANQVSPDMFSAFVFRMSHVVQAGWFPFITIFGAVSAFIVIKRQTREFAINLIMSKWSLLRQMIMGVRQFIFIGTLAMLQKSQVQMDHALEVCAEVLSKTPMGSEVKTARERYLTGISVSDCIRQYTSCDPTVVHMIAIGEKTGSIPEQLELCREMLEESTKITMDDFAAVVSFISTAVPVLMIGAIFLSSYLPIILMSARLMDSFS